jgi:hypothetical protein
MRVQHEAGFVRGIRACVEMLETMSDVDECVIASDTRKGRRQDNAVRRALGRVLMRADAGELDGFCAALTEIAARADEGDFGFRRNLAEYADRRERVVTQRTARRGSKPFA